MSNSDTSIEINQDASEAQLILAPHAEIRVEHILHVISENGICFGIDVHAVQNACTPCNTEKSIIIARGQNARNSLSPQLESTLDLQKSTLVNAGQFIGTMSEYNQGSVGMNVLGHTIPFEDTDSTLPLGNGLEMRQHEIYASIDGYLFQDKVGVWRVSSELRSPIELSIIELELSDDLFTAHITLKAHQWLQPAVVLQAIQDTKISFGFIPEALKSVVEPQAEERHILIAQGQLPHNGTDARVETYIDDSISYTIGKNGRVDFKSASIFKNISAHCELAQCHPATQGIAGMDIRGNKIEAQNGNDIDIGDFIDEGAIVSNDNADLIIAEHDGIFNVNAQGQIGVLQLLIIDGDVDMQIGNIETPYPIIIKGDIKSGFVVKSGSDILVEGLIEDSRVTALGNISVNKGILPGNERIKARGDLAALYIRERTVKARSIIISKSIRRSTVFATGDLHAQELLGGSTIVAELLEVETLGSETGHRTEITVGVDPYIKSLLDTLNEEYHNMHTESERLQPLVESTSKRASDLGKKFKLLQEEKQDKNYLLQLGRQAQRAVEESKRMHNDLRYARQKKKVLSAQIDTYTQELSKKENISRIVIHGCAWAPTMMHIGSQARYRIDSPIEKATIFLNSNGKITLTRASDSQNSQGASE